MAVILFKKQWRSFFVLALLFCGMLFVKNSIDSVFSKRYYDFQKAYMERSGLSTKDKFFENLKTDTENTKAVVCAIENYESYDGKYRDEMIDPLLVMAGEVSYVDYDMVIWRQEMLQLPGVYTDTISDDHYMMIQLSQRLVNQYQFEENLYNNTEIARRGLRRNDRHAVHYKAVLDELNKVDTDFQVQDTFFTDQLLEYLETDYFILIMLVLLVFPLFSSLHQNRISSQIRISKMNTCKFCVAQIMVSTLLCFLFSLLYYIGVIFVLSDGNLTDIAWELPIQAVNDHELIPFAISVRQYVLYFILFKVIFNICLLNMTMLISALCRNTVVSALASLVFCGGLIIIHHLYSNTLVIGSCRALMEDFAFISIGEQAIPKYFCVCAIAIFGAVAMVPVTIWGYKITTKKWVK